MIVTCPKCVGYAMIVTGQAYVNGHDGRVLEIAHKCVYCDSEVYLRLPVLVVLSEKEART